MRRFFFRFHLPSSQHRGAVCVYTTASSMPAGLMPLPRSRSAHGSASRSARQFRTQTTASGTHFPIFSNAMVCKLQRFTNTFGVPSPARAFSILRPEPGSRLHDRSSQPHAFPVPSRSIAHRQNARRHPSAHARRRSNPSPSRTGWPCFPNLFASPALFAGSSFLWRLLLP